MPFRPTQISNCAIWLDATDSTTIQTSGGGVSNWVDKSGSNYNFSQSDSGRYPTQNSTGINNLNTLYFTGPAIAQNITSKFLQNASVVIGSNYTVFSIGKQDTSAPSLYNYNYLTKASLTVDAALLYGSGDTSFGANNPGWFMASTGDGAGTWNDLNANTPLYSVKNAFLGCAVVSGFSVSPFFNGSNQTVKTGIYYTQTFTGMSLGEPQPNTFAGQNWNGLIGEFIVYNRALAASERQQIEGYLAWKWGLQGSLPSTHPYKNAPPAGPPVLISTNAELVLLNSAASPGIITLPSTNIVGRILTFKDIQGTFNSFATTFNTQNATQLFENNLSTFTACNAFGSYTFATGTDNKWYTIGGSYMDTASISSITSISMNLIQASTATVSMSTLIFEDTVTNSTNSVFLRSTLLYFSSPVTGSIFGGSRAPRSLFIRPPNSFSPLQIAGLNYWFDSSDLNVIRTSGMTVTTVINKGLSNQYPLLRNTGSPRTGFQVPNGLNCIRLGVNDSFVFTGNYAGGNSRTHIVVSRPLTNTASPTASASGVRFLFQNNTLDACDYFSCEGNNNVSHFYELSQGSAFMVDAIVPNLSNQLSIFAYRAFAATTASNTASLNGSNLTLVQSNPPAYNNLAAGQPFYVNDNSPGSIGSTQDYCEFLSWNSCLSLSQFQQVEGYLAWKWGLVGSLSPTHPYKLTPP